VGSPRDGHPGSLRGSRRCSPRATPLSSGSCRCVF
jgi:hypothetical protein